MFVIVIRKARSACYGIALLVLSLLIFVYRIFIDSGSAAKDRPQTSQREES